MEVEINGIKYRYIEHENTPRYSKRFSSLIMMAGLMGGFGGFNMFGKKAPERPKVDIVKEYELIQNKKSNLSKSQRDWVESQFESNFIKVE